MRAIDTKAMCVTSRIRAKATKFRRTSVFFAVLATTFGVATPGAHAGKRQVGKPPPVYVVERSGPWVSAVVAVPRGEVPRAHVAGIAAWLSASSGKTQGAVSLVRSRGAVVSAHPAAGGLLVRVEGPRADTRLIVNAALSILRAFSPSPGTFAAAKRSLLLDANATRDTPAMASRAAWQTWFNRPAPDRAPSSDAIAALSEVEVRAAWQALDRSHAALFVEVDPHFWAPPPKKTSAPPAPAGVLGAVPSIGLDTVLALVDPAFRPSLTAPSRRQAALPRPLAARHPMAEDARLPFVFTQPLPLDVAHDDVLREFLVRELSASLKAAVWVESDPDAALLFVWPNGPTTPRALRAAMTKWGVGLRWSRTHGRILAQIDDDRALRWTRVGDVSVHHAATWLSGVTVPSERPAADTGALPKAADGLELARVVEDLPLLIWPDTMRAFAVTN